MISPFRCLAGALPFALALLISGAGENGGAEEDAGLADHMPFTGDAGISVYERLWLRPAVAVTALEAVPLGESANQLIDEARARVSVRIAPGQDPERVRDCVVKRLVDRPLGRLDQGGVVGGHLVLLGVAGIDQ